jgi:hypothetical protein
MYAFNTAAANPVSGVNTITISPPTGALVIVFSITSGGGGTPTVVFSDNSSSTWANASNNVNVGGNHFSVGYCLAAAAGVTTITATYNGGTPGACNLVAIAYTGMSSPTFVALTAPNAQTAPGTGANLVTTTALSCGSTNALFVGMHADTTNANDGLTVGTGFTLRADLVSGANTTQIYLQDPNAEVTGSNTSTMTVASHGADTYGSIGIAFADNASGGGTATIAWVS